MIDEVKIILLNLAADLIICDSLGDFQEVRSDCFKTLLLAGFTDRHYPREKILSALVETGLVMDRGLKLES